MSMYCTLRCCTQIEYHCIEMQSHLCISKMPVTHHSECRVLNIFFCQLMESLVNKAVNQVGSNRKIFSLEERIQEPKQIKIREIANFTFFDPKKHCSKQRSSEIHQISKTFDQQFLISCSQNMSERCILCTFICFVREIW